MRVVLDTSTVVSALRFQNGRLGWLREHWRNGCTPLVSRETATELTRVLAYPKFSLSLNERNELLADYLPHSEIVNAIERCAVLCRDPNDQQFLNLAQSGKADVLVSGDKDLLELHGQTSFGIESPQAYALRINRY